MRQQRRLDLGAGDVVAGGDDHVVGARDERKMAVGADEGIAGHVPAVADIVRLPAVGEIAAARRTTHRKLSDGAVGQLVHVVVDDLRLIAGHGIAGGSRHGIADAVADEDVQQFRAADAVEDRFAGLFGPALEHRRRQRLASGDGKAQR